jgi:hypothetical protein
LIFRCRVWQNNTAGLGLFIDFALSAFGSSGARPDKLGAAAPNMSAFTTYAIIARARHLGGPDVPYGPNRYGRQSIEM